MRSVALVAAALAGWILGPACAPAPAVDPRLPLVELRLAGQPAEALARLEAFLADNPEEGRRLGLPYLRGHLLLELDRRREGLEALASTLVATPALAPYARYHLAVEQAALGHPEVAAGLLATLLARHPPAALVAPAARALRQAIAAGGDCLLLGTVPADALATSERRQLELAVAQCAARSGDPAAAEARRVRLLAEDTGDEAARLAAEALVAVSPEPASARTSISAGLAFHDHREFERAIALLARGIALPDAATLGRGELWEARYALARSHFWLERFGIAAAGFGAIADDAPDPFRRSRALYQEARCYELSGDWPRAAALFQRAAQAAPSASWADAATASLVRLAWKLGDEALALATVETLLTRRHDEAASRALLFLAASDVVQGRGDRARGWLQRIARLGQIPRSELAYWQGRTEETAGDPAAAVARYLQALDEGSHQPFVRAARARLRAPALAAALERVAARLAASRRPSDLRTAWLVLDGDPRGIRARDRLRAELDADPAARPFLELAVRPPASWRLWQERLDGAEERLLALGFFDEAAPVIGRLFPVSDPSLAFTGSLLLAAAGEHRRALVLAEVLQKRVPSRLPDELLPTAFVRLLYPFPYADEILRESARRGVDPYLLAGLIREESRFDPNAFSAASARGLTQFVLPTARRIAERAALPGSFHPERLEDPAVAIALGAVYLAELRDRFGGAVESMVAAYNAGEPQAELWRRYCDSDEPEEYLTKIAFKETRHYVRRVLASRARYLDLYAGLPVGATAPPLPVVRVEPSGGPIRRTTGGSGDGG